MNLALTILALAVLVAELVVIGHAFATFRRDGDAADIERIEGGLAEAREDLTAPDDPTPPVPAGVEGTPIGRRVTLPPSFDNSVEATVKLLAALKAWEPGDSPWRLPLEPGLEVSQAIATRPPTWGYRPRHAKGGDLTQEWERIVERLRADGGVDLAEVKA